MPLMKPYAVLFCCGGGPEEFETVLKMLEDATEGLLDAIRSSRLA